MNASKPHLYKGSYRGVRFHVNHRGLLALSDLEFKEPRADRIWLWFTERQTGLFEASEIATSVRGMRKAIDRALIFENGLREISAAKKRLLRSLPA